MMNTGLLRQGPQDPHIGVSRATIIQDDGSPAQQGSLHKIPHHPAGGAEPEKTLPGPDIVMEMQVL